MIYRHVHFKVAALAAGGLVSCAGDEPPRPNIIYIVADDLGYGDPGCYGQKLIATPNIDRMAAEGMLFTQHYAGCTVSAPSRSSLMTGLHTGHTPIRGNLEHKPEGQKPLPADTYTIAEMLRDAGYATGCFGKWGLGYPGSEGAPENQGFDEFYGYNCQRMAHNYYPYRLWHNGDTVWLAANAGAGRGDYSQDLIQRKALDFIGAKRDKPFFAMLTYVIPHAELVNPDDSIMASYRDRFPETPYEGVDSGPSFKLGGYCSTPHPRADFAAMVTRLDAYVGEVLALLKDSGLDRNTIVLFTSDNGPHREGGADPDFFRSYGPLRGVKRDLYEGGIRVPLIVRYPAVVERGAVSDLPCAFWDAMPTLATLAGAVVPATDGISIWPTLAGKTGEQQQHSHFFWEFHEEGGKMAVRKGNWKGVLLDINDPAKMRMELYDLSDDLHEDHDVAASNPGIVADMWRIMCDEHTPSPQFPFTLPAAPVSRR